MRHRAKFREDRLNHSGDMADFQDGGSLKVGNFNFRSGSGAEYALLRQNLDFGITGRNSNLIKGKTAEDTSV